MTRFALPLSLLCAIGIYAHATTITVINTNDSGPGSLRQALAVANDGDTILFDPALNGQSIALTSAELVIDKSVTLSGPGSDLLSVTASGHSFRVFHAMPGHVATIAGLTITDGTIQSGDNGGGGIFNEQSTLTVDNCSVRRNYDYTWSGGGGIRNSGASASLTILNSTITFNFSAGGPGGGIYNDSSGTVVISNSTVSTNESPLLPQPGGGGIFNAGLMEITSSMVTSNHGGFNGGGISNQGTLTITNSTISDNLAGTNYPNIAAGGGIANDENSGRLTITNSTISGNRANGKNAGWGGGIWAGAPAFQPIGVTSSISGVDPSPFNTNSDRSIWNSPSHNPSTLVRAGTVEISNSTISGNLANRNGGGVYNFGPIHITKTTISNNAANEDAGGIRNSAPGIVELGSTILNAGASGANIVNSGATITSHGYNLCSDDGGGFLIGPGDQINTDPILGSLQDNGGPTFTQALLPNSPAIDTGDPNFTPPPFFDQRGPGFNRVANSHIDKGSFEVQLHGPVVTNTNDSGPGSLREALVNAQNGDTITFNIPMEKTKGRGEGVVTTITLTSGELVINKNIAISGLGANLLAVSRATEGAPFRIFHVTPDHTVTIEGLAISNGLISNGFGGGILNDQSILTINNCALSENSAMGPQGLGGGIFSNGSGAGGSASLTVTDTTLSANTASNGGAIFNDGASGMAGLIISNSTLSGNSQNGIFSDGTATISITNSTVNENAAVNISILAGMLDIGNTVLKAAEPGVNLNIGKPATVTSLGYNLSSDDAGGFLTGTGDQINTDPLLGPLQDNGGPTFTHELLPDSPAIDAGDPTFTPPPSNDQRGPGFPRVVNGRLDKGSFEVQGATATPTPTSTPSPATPTSTPTATPTATATSTPTATPTPRPTPAPRASPSSRPRPTPIPRLTG